MAEGVEPTNCPEHGDLCGRANWTGFCRWRTERASDQSPDYYDALSAALARIDELEAQTDQARNQERQRIQEALLSEAFLDSAVYKNRELLERAIRAKLDTLDPSGEQGEEWPKSITLGRMQAPGDLKPGPHILLDGDTPPTENWEICRYVPATDTSKEDGERQSFECPVCHRPMMGPNEACNGSFTEADHPTGVKAVSAYSKEVQGDGE